ncbi:MAG TPA: IPT/TIG domain-containing protein, partial [Kineosporiaceae bacterium]|nr:IPT/TIG domain-containing protein [Kineosporiaceae bacterium]
MSILKTAAASRVARFVAVAGVVGASLIGVAAAPANAATTAATVTPTTGSTAGGTVMTGKGKNFINAAGTVVLVTVTFQTTACTVDATVGTDVTAINVLDATTAMFTTPALAANTAYYACFYDGTTATQQILGQASGISIQAPPTATNIGGGATYNASTAGGASTTVTGTNFTNNNKTSATIDGVNAKAVYVNATTITITLPAHAASPVNPATPAKVVVTTQYGTATSTGSINYYPTLKLGSTYGLGAANTPITITGTGFSSYDFVNTTAWKNFIGVGYASQTLNNTVVIATLKTCSSIIVASDT